MLTTCPNLNLCLWQCTMGHMLLVDPILVANSCEDRDLTYHSHFLGYASANSGIRIICIGTYMTGSN